MSSIDHIVIATKDAEKAAQSIYAHFGLAAYSGGRLTVSCTSLLGTGTCPVVQPSALSFSLTSTKCFAGPWHRKLHSPLGEELP